MLVRLLIAGLALLSAVGCGSRRIPGYDPNATTLCVENTAVGYGNLVVYAGSQRFTVYSGDQECRDIRAVGSGLSVRAITTSGGSMGPLRFSFNLPSSTGCWHWRVSNSYSLDIVECDP